MDWYTAVRQVEEKLAAHSFKHLPSALQSMAKAREEGIGRHDKATQTVIHGMSYFMEKREWDNVALVWDEYMALFEIKDEDILDTNCPDCDKLYSVRSWRCLACGSRRHLSKASEVSMSEALKVRSWHDWRACLDTVVVMGQERNYSSVMIYAERAIDLMKRQVVTRHSVYDHYLAAMRSFCEQRNTKPHVRFFTEKFKLVWVDSHAERVCGAKSHRCANVSCRFSFSGEHDELWICPDCNWTRVLCMVGTLDKNGRCARHGGRRRDGDTSYYEFKSLELQDSYDRYVGDIDLNSNIAQIAVLDTRIGQLTSQGVKFDGAEFNALIERTYRDFHQVSKEFNRGVDSMDKDDLAKMFNRMRGATAAILHSAKASMSEQNAYDEIASLFEVRRRQEEITLKRQIANQHTVTISDFMQAMTMYTQLFVQALSAVPDVDLRRRIQDSVHESKARLITDGTTINGVFTIDHESEKETANN